MKDHSLQERLQGSWKQLQGSVRSEWGKLTHDDVEQIKGNVEVLAGKLQERYGMTEAAARKQIEQWVSNFRARHAADQSSNTAS